MSSNTLLTKLLAVAVGARALTAFGGGTVTTNTEAALRAALTGGGLVIFTNDASISIGQQIIINQAATTIDARGHTVSINSSNSVPLFRAATNLTLRGLTLLNGSSLRAGGALYIQPGAVVVASQCVFSGNSVVATNGLSGSNGTTNSNNSGGNGTAGLQGPSALGGAIYNLGSLALVKCTLKNNRVNGGSGGAGGSGGPGGGAFAIGGNGGDGAPGGAASGGAVYNGGNLTLIDCNLFGNTALGGAGGQGGAAGTGSNPGRPGHGGMGGTGSGGGVYNAANLTVLTSAFATNSVTGGSSAAGGMESDGTGMKGLKGGLAAGGAIFNNWWMSITNCTFYTNAVVGGAGGTGGNGGGTFAVPGDGGDGGDGFGGALNNVNTITMVNCTLSGSGAFGGTNGAPGTGNFTASAGNPGSADGGNIANTGPIFIMANSILAASVSGANAFGSFTDAGYNLNSDDVNPRLGTLAANGGPTLTIALLPGSPGIDRIPADAAPVTDQRGFSRPINGASDIGSFEYGASGTVSNLTAAITPAANGVIHVTGGTAGLTYILQASTNLSTWQTISTNTAPFSFSDPTTNVAVRFYRIKR